MRKAHFLEYLGELSGTLIADNLTNRGEFAPSAEDLKQAFSHGCAVSVLVEQEIHETPEEKKTLSEGIANKLQRASGIEIPGRKIVGLVLTPK